MRRLSIGRALVRTAFEDLDSDVLFSNGALLDTCEKHDELTACPVVVPSSGGDFPPENEQIETLLARGAGAVCIRPKQDCWLLCEWASGLLFAELQERRVPVVCREHEVNLEQLGDLAGRYPDMPLVLLESGYRTLRTLLPLLENFSNIYLSLGSAFTVLRGIETLVERVGAGRLLFGTGFPASEPMMAVTQLMYAEISDVDKNKIGSENLKSLIKGIRR
jgi:hypothetical protein